MFSAVLTGESRFVEKRRDVGCNFRFYAFFDLERKLSDVIFLNLFSLFLMGCQKVKRFVIVILKFRNILVRCCS